MNKYAYVTVLYGNNIYLTGALVLGYSLMKTDTAYDRIILVTPDVSEEYRSYLKHVFTYVTEISYVHASPEIFADKDTRFKEVFTKLQCLSLVQYEKVIVLDSDMIIAKNIDHLFRLAPPAACVKFHNVPYGQKVPPELICSNGKLVGSINAGLMLLHPDEKEWEEIQADILKDDQPNKFKYPEQDYLSLRYCDKWTSIPFNYNFQFDLTGRVKKMHYKIQHIYVIHYSSVLRKPWNDLIKDRAVSDEEAEIRTRHDKYYTLWTNAYNTIKEKFAKDGIMLPY